MLTLKEKIEREISLALKKLSLVEKHPDLTEMTDGLFAASAAPWCGLYRWMPDPYAKIVVPYYQPDPELRVHGHRVVVLARKFGELAETDWRARMASYGYAADLIERVGMDVAVLLESKE